MLIPDDLSPRRKNRIFAIQFVYSWSIDNDRSTFDLEHQIDNFISEFFPENADKYQFGRELAIGSISNLDVIDELIKKHAIHWTIDRIAAVDLAILRVITYEMLFREDIPPIVSINEGIDISKIMSSDESGKFLNGVLEGIKKELTRPLR